MDRDKRKDWLKDLKPGDEVTVESVGFGYRDYAIKKIDKISPTGRITIGGAVFSHKGKEMGIKDSWTRAKALVPVSQEIKDYVRRKKLYTKVKNIDWAEVSLVNLEEIARILKID
ncbi:hypothetical protein FDC45_17820 [Clostridium botulinum]|uniref:Uncharacterized protein n=1 Tax=Clostridium botulinum TaxID=1491 RepID=A0A846J663_CLOBO|nr:hypothetical protein [Clostridium botulinum]ACA57451.1 conserved hypothetical protein [Clostridium botulinum A3 str. Loch Maree]NFH67027.1 hypothetical protein [Clostridium botulinum]NFJ09616.1 hypothetical protein [Clostridium botulinum]NFK16585.1 hypothetical protein [Clostridium botulinum]NFM94310.1 hypothetical protein [Clostridium botulinum]